MNKLPYKFTKNWSRQSEEKIVGSDPRGRQWGTVTIKNDLDNSLPPHS